MALTKQPVSINFSQGVQTKSDPFQLPIGNFLSLSNSVFTTGGRLSKRNGFTNITTLPNADQTTLTTLDDNLIATGSNLYTFSADVNQWINKGPIQPVQLSVLPAVRSSASQSTTDMGVSANGLGCLVFKEGSTTYYQIIDSVTSQQVVARTALPATATLARTFVLGQYFIITYLVTITAVNHLEYIAIPISTPNSPRTQVSISATISGLTAGYDGIVANNNLYLGWAKDGTHIQIAYLTSTLVVSTAVTMTGSHTATLMSLTSDTSGSLPIIWVSFWDSSSANGYTAAYSSILAQVLAPTQIITTTSINEITSVADDSVLTVFYENANTYGAGPNSSVKTDFISKLTVTQPGVVSSASVVLRSVGLASKAFIDPITGDFYMIVTYGEGNQPSFFLMDTSGNIYMRLAYSNAGGYLANQILPSVSTLGEGYYVPYLFADFVTTTNKGTNLPSGTPSNAIYTQVGVNVAQFTINNLGQHSSEIASALHLTGGQLWEYDGIKPVEHGFHVWPDNVAGTTSPTGGSMVNQKYYYQFTYEWTDGVGNLHRSAPSIPTLVDSTSGSPSSNTNTIYVPTLRITAKTTPNPARIVGYRWSTAQQVYYQFTSISSPTLNNPAVDYVTITDTLSDASILGNAILYTTGGVIENIAAPASVSSALFNNRLFLIDAEDQNLLWFSKQVIETTPVEMSDLLTLFVAPTTGAQGSTGPMTALSAMDDKLIIFKKDAIYYINGNGPDNTGSNNSFSDPIYISSSVGCPNPNSIILMPDGLMFQSDKGIWLLGRGLETQYIGAPVEAYNSQTVTSAQVIPGTNQVRFILDNNIMLVYDYYYNQWSTFTSRFAISSTLYQGLHTYLNTYGQVYQETAGMYNDGSNPVLMSFSTGWINIAGVQGFERFYSLNLLGTYFSPFLLSTSIAYDYNPSPQQTTSVYPDNFVQPWGGEAVWGSGGKWGGPGNVFSARLFPQKQKCQSFQIQCQEVYNASQGQVPGQGLSLSGLLLMIGVKRGSRTQSAAKSFG